MSDEQVARLSMTCLGQLVFAVGAGDEDELEAITEDLSVLSLELERRGYGPAAKAA